MKKPFFKVSSAIGLALLGCGYFTTFSQMDLPMGLENYLILVPVQLGVLAYFFIFRKPSQQQLPLNSPRKEE